MIEWVENESGNGWLYYKEEQLVYYHIYKLRHEFICECHFFGLWKEVHSEIHACSVEECKEKIKEILISAYSMDISYKNEIISEIKKEKQNE